MEKSGIIDGWPGTYWINQITSNETDKKKLMEKSQRLLEESKTANEYLNNVIVRLKDQTLDDIKKKGLEKLELTLQRHIFYEYNEPIALNRAKIWLITHKPKEKN
jgi:ABC-type metal ion transport system substrate-binding protein